MSNSWQVHLTGAPNIYFTPSVYIKHNRNIPRANVFSTQIAITVYTHIYVYSYRMMIDSLLKFTHAGIITPNITKRPVGHGAWKACASVQGYMVYSILNVWQTLNEKNCQSIVWKINFVKKVIRFFHPDTRRIRIHNNNIMICRFKRNSNYCNTDVIGIFTRW